MHSQKVAHYDSPHQFEPLMPGERLLGPLLEQASDLIRAVAAVGATAAQEELRALLRAMNSYYTNRIEGEHTRPIDIERALQQEFSANADTARKQRLALAHIHTETSCEKHLDQSLAEGGNVVRDLYSLKSLQWLHRSLFEQIDGEDLRLADGSNLLVGELRQAQVAIGIHEAPLHSALPGFIARWADVYGNARRGEMSIVAAAASHHRLAWIHPFSDGNGRVSRLHTHLVMYAMGLTKGLWSPLRGFARSEDRYRALLRGADEHRRGDLDGRGNLTTQGLIDWISYTLEVCIDQVQFMAAQLDVTNIQSRIEAALLFDASTKSAGVRIEALAALHYLFATQLELGRSDFKSMTGLGDRVATDLLSSLLKAGYLASDSPYGKVRFAVPRHALRFYFPNLWPEAERDVDMLKPAPAPQHEGKMRERPVAQIHKDRPRA
ncbi:Fic family protein [Caenimonas sedimenti]|uniref:Fic family protein n=1 Tax=Caenimonas sedimenti TaxID=2596921 RepID=A0A562ZHL0_9BURK|nr:Fic family protein [Caenimonas sedimenti]TWO68080.1 Fic family protein [Caenimonas sedimenti]